MPESVFKDYAEIIEGLVGYETTKESWGEGRTDYSYDISGSRAALGRLCAIQSPIASNLLHHAATLPDVMVTVRVGEAEYSAENPGGMAGTEKPLSFAPVREAAQEELAKRGNPAYDATTYGVVGCWTIPDGAPGENEDHGPAVGSS